MNCVCHEHKPECDCVWTPDQAAISLDNDTAVVLGFAALIGVIIAVGWYVYG